MARKEYVRVILLPSSLKYTIGHIVEPGRYYKDSSDSQSVIYRPLALELPGEGYFLICRMPNLFLDF